MAPKNKQTPRVDSLNHTILVVLFLAITYTLLVNGFSDLRSSGQAFVLDATTPISPGDIVKVDMVASDVTDFMGAQVWLSYNSNILEFNRVEQGPLLKQNDEFLTIFSGGDSSIPGQIDGITISRWATNPEGGEVVGTNQDGVVATVYFNAVAEGSSEIKFSRVILSDSDANDITTGLLDTVVEVIAGSEPPPNDGGGGTNPGDFGDFTKSVKLNLNIQNVQDLAGIQFSVNYDPDLLTYTHFEEGEFLNANGAAQTYSSVTGVSNGQVRDIIIARIEATGVSGTGRVASVYFGMNGDNFGSPGFGSIILSDSDGQALTSGFSFTSTLEITNNFPWDVNKDNRVDVLDIVEVVHRVIGKKPYDANLDLTGPGGAADGAVNVLDLVVVAQHVGEVY